ncbi:MAG: hypothetical protein J6R42_04555, partial [Clostridia bacterium]|nr:hypothetical protein [Clostridia bacterium]
GENPPVVVPTTPEEIVNAAYGLAQGAVLEGTYSLTGVIVSVDELYNAQYGSITVTIVVGDMTDKPIKCYHLKGEGVATLKIGDTITVTGVLKNYYGTIEFDNGCTASDIVPGEGGNTEVEGTVVSVIIADLAAANGWVNATKYTSFTMDEVITVSCTGSDNSGKYYNSGTNWRLYQTESATMTIAAKDGYKIASITITYASEKTGCLVIDGANFASGSTYEADGASSVTFSVSDTNAAEDKGQARITSITVVYVAE